MRLNLKAHLCSALTCWPVSFLFWWAAQERINATMCRTLVARPCLPHEIISLADPPLERMISRHRPLQKQLPNGRLACVVIGMLQTFSGATTGAPREPAQN